MFNIAVVGIVVYSEVRESELLRLNCFIIRVISLRLIGKVLPLNFGFFPSRVDEPIRQKTKACFDSAEGGGGRTDIHPTNGLGVGKWLFG